MNSSVAHQENHLPFDCIVRQIRGRCRDITDKHRLVRLVVAKFVISDDQLGGGLRHTFCPNRNSCAMVRGVRTFLQGVLVHDQRSAVRYVHQVARGALLAVRNLIADQFGPERTRFHVMPYLRLEEPRVLNAEQCDVTDIDAVRAVGLTLAVVDKLPVRALDTALCQVSSEDAVLIVDEAAMLDREVSPLSPYACAVTIGHARARKRDIANGDVAADSYEERLPLAGFVGDHHTRPFAHNRQVARIPYRAVKILAGLDLDRVTGRGQRSCCAWRLELVAWSDLQCFGVGCAAQHTDTRSR